VYLKRRRKEVVLLSKISRHTYRVPIYMYILKFVMHTFIYHHHHIS